MELILLKISILKTAIRVLTCLCFFLPAFVSPFYTDVPDLYFYFVGFCIIFLIVQINFFPNYKINGKIQIEETGISIQFKNKTHVYRSSDIKRIDIEYKGYRGGEHNISLPIFLPLTSQDGINTLYIETIQGEKDWIYFLALKNIKRNLISLQTLFLNNGVNFQLIIN